MNLVRRIPAALLVTALLFLNSATLTGQCSDILNIDLSIDGACQDCEPVTACVGEVVTLDNQDVFCCLAPINANRCRLINLVLPDGPAACLTITATPQDNGSNWFLIDYQDSNCGTAVTDNGQGDPINLDVYDDDGGVIQLVVCKQGTGDILFEACAIPCCTISNMTCPSGITYNCYEEVPTPTTIDDFYALGGVVNSSDLSGTACEDIGFSYSDDSTPSDICTSNTFTRTFEICYCNDQVFTCTQVINIDPDNEYPYLEIDGYSSMIPSTELGCQSNVPSMPSELPITDVSDDCTILSPDDVTITDDYPGDQVAGCDFRIIRTYSVEDDCGLITELSEEINYTLNLQSPQLVNPPQDITLDCFSSVDPPEMVIWTDDCDGTGDAIFSETGGPINECTGGTLFRTWSYTDACGADVSHTQEITINVPPQVEWITPPADISVACVEDIPAGQNLAYTNNTNDIACLISGDVAPTDTALPSTCGGSMTRTWEYVPACGQTITHIQTITLSENNFPIIENVPSDEYFSCLFTVNIDDTPLDWNDDCNESGQVTAVSFPTVSSIGCSGGISTLIWTVTDKCDNTTIETQEITVGAVDDVIWITSLPADITIDCNDPIPSPIDLDYSNLGNTGCENFGTVSGQSDNADFLICGDVITYTWTLDADPSICLNAINHTQTITLRDIDSPTLSDEPADVTLDCFSAYPDIPDIDWFDNCDGTGTAAFVENGGPIDECVGGQITRTWSYTDQCDLTVSHTQTITFLAPPAFDWTSFPADLTVSCVADVPDPEPLFYENNTSEPSCVIAGSVDPVDSGTLIDCNDILTRTWTYTTACFETITWQQEFTLFETNPPTINNVPADITYSCYLDVPVDIVQLSWDDDCGESGTVDSVADLMPEDLGCDGGDITLTWTVTDKCGNTTTENQIISIDEMEEIVWLTAEPANYNIECGDLEPSYDDQTFDNNLSGDCNISGTADLDITGDLLQCGDVKTFEWTAMDQICGTTLIRTATISLIDNEAPQFTDPPQDLTLTCFEEIEAIEDLDFTDNCIAPSSVVGTEVISPDPISCDGGTITRTWTIADDCDNETTHQQTITILAKLDIDWITSLPQDQNINCSDILDAPIDLEYSNLSDGLCLLTGVVSGIDNNEPLINCGDQRTYVWIVAEDLSNCTNSIVHTQTFTLIDDIDPVIYDLPVDITIECGTMIEDLIPDLAWDDNCGAGGFVAGTQDILPSDLACNAGTITRTWTVTDDCDNTVTVNQIIEVTGPDPISFTGTLPQDVTIACADDIPNQEDILYSNLSVNTECLDDGTANQLTPLGEIDFCGSVLTYRWEAIGSCGEIIEYEQNITYQSSVAPTLSEEPADITIQCNAELPPPPSIDWMDDCGNSAPATFNETSLPDDCSNGSITRSWEYTDICDNQVYHEQIITVLGIPPIQWTSNLPVDITISCGDEIPSVDLLTYDNGGNTDCFVEGDLLPVITGDLVCGSSETRYYEITDDCGNTLSHTQIITFLDIIPPVFTTTPADVTVECESEVPSATQLEWTDNCDINGLVDPTDQGSIDPCLGGSIIRTWTYTDMCGNLTVSYSQNIFAEEIPDVTWTNNTLPQDVTVNCNDPIPDVEILDYSNNAAAASCLNDGQVIAEETGSLNICGDVITRTWTLDADPTNCLNV